jgi:Saxitoxin biosynthesis operon protein SxtJ
MALIAFTWKPTRGQLRWFGCLWLPLVFALIAWRPLAREAAGHRGEWDLAIVAGLGALGLLSLVAGLAAPRLLRPVFVGLLIITWPIGFVVSHVILAALFFLLLTPTAWVMRAMCRDALHLAISRQAPSYWQPRAGSSPLSRYFNQF